jgi:hypothetical protein
LSPDGFLGFLPGWFFLTGFLKPLGGSLETRADFFDPLPGLFAPLPGFQEPPPAPGFFQPPDFLERLPDLPEPAEPLRPPAAIRLAFPAPERPARRPRLAKRPAPGEPERFARLPPEARRGTRLPEDEGRPAPDRRPPDLPPRGRAKASATVIATAITATTIIVDADFTVGCNLGSCFPSR